MNTKNKITAIFLAGIMVCLVMAFALPAVSGVTQSATVTTNTIAVAIVNQSGLAANTIDGWTFTGAAGETNATPANTGSNGGELQDFGATTPVAFLNNTHSAPMLVYLTAGAWDPAGKVGSEHYTNTNPANAAAISNLFAYDSATSDVSSGGLASNAKLGLWLKLELKKAGTPTSTFTVESEVA